MGPPDPPSHSHIYLPTQQSQQQKQHVSPASEPNKPRARSSRILTSEGRRFLRDIFDHGLQRPTLEERKKLLLQIRSIPHCEEYQMHQLAAWFVSNRRRHRKTEEAQTQPLSPSSTSPAPDIRVARSYPRSAPSPSSCYSSSTGFSPDESNQAFQFEKSPVLFFERDLLKSHDLGSSPSVHSPPKILSSEVDQNVGDDFDGPNYFLPFPPVSEHMQLAPMTNQKSTLSLESSFETEESDLSLFASFFKMEAFDTVEESPPTQDGSEDTPELSSVHIHSPDADQSSSSGLVEQREDHVASPNGLSLVNPSIILESPQENVDSIPSAHGGKSFWPSYHNSVRHLIS
ncbi:hypothetical protein BDP27DRAFT_621748 [Rhodocollybia butyracea]|uniref:Homeobox domain-containing protein n=1 Tax=Rhodocollybia butyracea TaxID=206335 RepID=A0A9P5U8W7_9AGAR|nr:hypothetical protein BDP27DRAFT_621748 [Rhodocollybia butyracea]